MSSARLCFLKSPVAHLGDEGLADAATADGDLQVILREGVLRREQGERSKQASRYHAVVHVILSASAVTNYPHYYEAIPAPIRRTARHSRSHHGT
jgi:hypothetical protein